MLFGFRGVRAFQVILAIIALACGAGGVLSLKAYTDGERIMILPGILLLIVFLWAFATALRAPTSFVAVDLNKGRTRIRFAGFVDTVIDNGDVSGARLVHRRWWGGLGVRLGSGGRVALASAAGECAELDLRRPVRVWLIPRLVPVTAHHLQLSVRHPAKLVEAFRHGGVPAPAPSPAETPARRMKRRGPRAR